MKKTKQIAADNSSKEFLVYTMPKGELKFEIMLNHRIKLPQLLTKNRPKRPDLEEIKKSILQKAFNGELE
jgi:hypothetical protein